MYSVWVVPYLSIDSLMPLRRARENQLQRAASTTQWAGIWWISISWSSSCLSMGSPPWVWSMTMSPISITVNSSVTIPNHLLLSNLSYSQPTNDKWCFNRQHLTYINVNVIKKNKRSMCKELTSNKNDFKNHVCVLLFFKQL